MNKTVDKQKKFCYNCRAKSFFENTDISNNDTVKTCTLCGAQENGPKDFYKMYSSYVYTEVCPKCGKTVSLLSHQEEDCENSTIVFAFCSCGEHVKFELPTA